MARQKGTPKTGGRTKGVPNKTTEEIREMIKRFVQDNWKSLQADFDKMKPLERALFREKMIKLFLPDPVTPEKLTEPQLEQLYIYLRKKYINEQAEKEP